MKRGLSAAVGLAVSLLAQRAAARDRASQSYATVRMEAGPALYALGRHRLAGADAALALGVEIEERFALHARWGVTVGYTEEELFTRVLPLAGFESEWLFDRLRLGVGGGIHYLSIDRATSDDRLESLGFTAAPSLCVDLLESRAGELYLGARGAVGWYPAQWLGGGSLVVGMRVRLADGMGAQVRRAGATCCAGRGALP